MKRIFLLLAVVTVGFFQSCVGPEGVPGQDGTLVSEVFELRNVNFTLDFNDEYTIYRTLNPSILDSDNILIYRLSGTIDPNTPIWQLIPRTLFLPQGELDYDFDFSKEDFTIYAGGNYDVIDSPSYINDQTFRIVILAGEFSNKGTQAVDFKDYNAVIKAYNINDTNVKVIK